jgi:hypothetical protein
MSNNKSLGAVQVFSADPVQINVALMELANRIDQLKGLRGRALVHDRVRLDNPTASDDGVALGILQKGTAAATYPLYMAPSTPLFASKPGTSYVELNAMLRQQINFAYTQAVQGRVIIEGWGTESTNGKGVAITDSLGTVLCEVTWNGNTPALQVGAFTAINKTTDQFVEIRAKGSSVTESLILHSVVFDLRYSVNTTTT